MDLIPLNGETWIICGGRDFEDTAMLNDAMSEIIHSRGCPSRIVEGGAGGVRPSGRTFGADRLAWEWATRMAIPCSEIYADWDQHGKAAGPIRNQKMIDEHKPSMVVAFSGGRGTASMVALARKSGIDVIEVRRRGPETPHPSAAPKSAGNGNKKEENSNG